MRRRKRGQAAWLMLYSLKGVEMLSRGLAKVGLQWTGLTKAVKPHEFLSSCF